MSAYRINLQKEKKLSGNFAKNYIKQLFKLSDNVTVKFSSDNVDSLTTDLFFRTCLPASENKLGSNPVYVCTGKLVTGGGGEEFPVC